MDKRYFKKLRPVADQVVAGYEAGMSLTELADFYKVSPSTVSSMLKEFNVTRRRRGPRSKNETTKKELK